MSSDLEAAPPAAILPSAAASESDPLLPQVRPPLLRPSRASYRKRRISATWELETGKSRFWTAVLGGVLAVALITTAVVLGVVHATRAGRRKSPAKNPAGETPDYSKLPGPKAGLRNPNYLVQGWGGAVASEVDVCSQIGVDVLAEGGYAADAAIATTLCIGVTNMFSSGIGGGGFMVIRPPSDRSLAPSSACDAPIYIDFRETAPTGSHARMFSPREDDPTFDGARASKIGGLAVGVPGELRGLEEAYTRCGGGLPWARLVQPSADLARESKVGKELARRLNSAPFGTAMSAWMLEEEDWKAMFAPAGTLLTKGETLRREAYAQTLEAVGRDGAGAFYEGPIAESIVETVQQQGGLLTLDDMRSYRANVGPALEGSYRNRTLYTVPAPCGGPALLNLLNTLETYEDYADEGQTGLNVHRFVESLKFAFAARTEIGDPPFINNSARIHEITTKKYARETRTKITDDHTHTLEYYNPRFDSILDDHGTTHLSVIDKFGSAVAVTSTVNLLFGSRVMDAQTGVILNDEMDDFATPDIPDAFGLRPSPFNFPAAGKRPLSSTAPLVMDTEQGEVRLALGGSGGSRIFGSVAQVLLNLDWGFDVANAVEQPRVHDQLSPAYVSVESGYRPDLVQALRDRGHNITLFDVNLGIAETQLVLRRDDGKFFATSDSRKNGVPAAF